jgi:hypothetical protein
VAERRELRGAAFVAMVEATQMGNSHDIAVGRRHDGSRHRRIFLQRQVSAGFQIVLDVGAEHATEPAVIGDDDVIEAFSANRSDQPLRIGILATVNARR